MTTQEAENVRAVIALWIERQILKGNFPVILICINEMGDIDVERRAVPDNRKVISMLRYVADEIEKPK